MKGTEFILRSILADGADHVFMVPGGLIDPFYPALQAVPELTPIVAAQEGGAAFAADGYAQGPYLLDVKTERDAPTPVEPHQQAAAAWSYEE